MRNLAILIGTLSVIAGPLFAQQSSAPKEPSEPQTKQQPMRPIQPTKTGKERLGPKWSDEQRVDDCHVPPERRSRPRPIACPDTPNG